LRPARGGRAAGAWPRPPGDGRLDRAARNPASPTRPADRHRAGRGPEPAGRAGTAGPV